MCRLVLAVLLLAGCGGTVADPDGGPGTDAGVRDAAIDAADAGGTAGSAVHFVLNASGAHEYGRLQDIPPGFGNGELTLELWIRPDASFPVGSTASGDDQLRNWSDADEAPYGSSDWWFPGNFLLDGHDNASFSDGTFSLQFYGGGRVRWLVGDTGSRTGGLHASEAYPATTTPSLLDGRWHRLAVVRRFTAAPGATLELWVDGDMVGTETTTERADLRTWFDGWAGFPAGQEGWFFGSEKQAAIGVLSQYEDYKGDVAELRFWSVARDPAALAGEWDRAITSSHPGLAGWFPFDEGSGDRACDALDRTRCIELTGFAGDPWIAEGPPLRP